MLAEYCVAGQWDRLPQGSVQVARNFIVNGVDLGWPSGVNRGIGEAHRKGIVPSASLLASGEAFGDAVDLARKTEGLGLGVHLNLSDGPPIAAPEAVPSLLNNADEFEGGPDGLLLKIATRGLSMREVETEW